MVGFKNHRTPLPTDIALTERSRKFYDGTYKWNSEGFTDDAGVYREFDCYNPAARAPTPLPPMCLSDDDEGGGAVGQEDSTARSFGDDTSTFRFATDVKNRGSLVTVRYDELFRDHTDREHLISKMEDALTESRRNKVNLTLDECYRLCVAADHVRKVDKLSNQGHVVDNNNDVVHGQVDDGLVGTRATLSQTHQPKFKPVTPVKTIISDLRNVASPSELSDCPSDISEWDVGKPVLKTRTTANKPIDEMFEQDSIDDLKWKPTTRGVAQKVKRGAKKPTTGPIKSSPRMESLHTGSYMRGPGETSRRRSTRLSNGQGGK